MQDKNSEHGVVFSMSVNICLNSWEEENNEKMSEP